MSHSEDSIKTEQSVKPVIYACSGCSDAGELADRVARKLARDGVGEMSCLAGIGGRVKPLMMKGQRAERIVVIDGCPLTCARHTLALAGLKNVQHIKLHELGQRKGSCPVTDERVSEVATAVADLMQNEVAKIKQPTDSQLVVQTRPEHP